MKIDILAIGAHPDDVELSCSGTLLRHISMGKTIGLLDLTRGELGSRGSAELREKEAFASGEKMSAAFRWQLGMEDGMFAHNPLNLMRIISALRACRPEIVLANALDDRHPDHARAAKLSADACFYSGLAKIEILDEDGKRLEPWRPKALYHYIQDKDLEPDFVVDITPFIEQKFELVLTFRSQFFLEEPEHEFRQELKTPISGKDFLEFLKAKNRAFGRRAMVEFAEGFNVARTPGVNNLFDLI